MQQRFRVAWGGGEGSGYWHLSDRPIERDGATDWRVWWTKCGLKFVRPGVGQALPVDRKWPDCPSCNS